MVVETIAVGNTVGANPVADYLAELLTLTPAVELRAIGPARSRGPVSCWVTPDASSIEAATDWAAARNASGCAVYSTFNRIDAAKTGAAKDADVATRNFIFIDIDPVRPTGTPASDDQRAAASAIADGVASYLQDRGWGEPARRHDSGNGVSLFYRSSPDVGAAAVNALLHGLNARFGGPLA